MYEIFAEMNKIPHEKRKEWGSFGHYVDYTPYMEEINKEISRLDGNLRSSKDMNKVKA